jgi:hypothetical protein
MDLAAEKDIVERAGLILEAWWDGQLHQLIIPSYKEHVGKEQESCIVRNARIIREIRNKLGNKNEKAWDHSYRSVCLYVEVVDLWNEQLEIRLEKMRVADMMVKEV